MSFYFQSIDEDQKPLRASGMLMGGSSSGKTLTACLLARGITGGAPWGFVDTEGDRAKHHWHRFPEMKRLALPTGDDGYPPERLISVIDAAEEAGLEALVIDSFSHFWEGVGGILEIQTFELDAMVQEAEARANGRYAINRDNYSQLAWAKVKPRSRRLTNRIIQAKPHVILCVRAKPLIVDRNGKPMRSNKLRRPDLAWDVAVDKDLIFEMTFAFLMNPENPGHPYLPPIKLTDEHRPFFPVDRPISEASGAAFREWSLGKHDQGDKEVYDRARGIARKGKQAFTDFWNSSAGKKQRAALQAILPQLRQIADEADAMSVTGDDPFGGALSPEEQARMDAAEAAWREQQAQAEAELSGGTRQAERELEAARRERKASEAPAGIG